MAFFPFGGEAAEPNIFDLLHLKREPHTEAVAKQIETEVAINETEIVIIPSSEQAAETELFNIEETETDTAAGHDIFATEDNMDTEEAQTEKNNLVQEIEVFQARHSASMEYDFFY